MAYCDYIFEIRAHSYSNSESKISNGRCCDSVVSSNCRSTFFSECENRFVFCLRQFDAATDGDATDCPLGSYSTGNIGDDDFNFATPDIADGVPNPLLFYGAIYPVSNTAFNGACVYYSPLHGI